MPTMKSSTSATPMHLESPGCSQGTTITRKRKSKTYPKFEMQLRKRKPVLYYYHYEKKHCKKSKPEVPEQEPADSTVESSEDITLSSLISKWRNAAAEGVQEPQQAEPPLSENLDKFQQQVFALCLESANRSSAESQVGSVSLQQDDAASSCDASITYGKIAIPEIPPDFSILQDDAVYYYEYFAARGQGEYSSQQVIQAESQDIQQYGIGLEFLSSDSILQQYDYYYDYARMEGDRIVSSPTADYEFFGLAIDADVGTPLQTSPEVENLIAQCINEATDGIFAPSETPSQILAQLRDVDLSIG